MAPASSSPVAPVSDSQTMLAAADSSSRLGPSGGAGSSGESYEGGESSAVPGTTRGARAADAAEPSAATLLDPGAERSTSDMADARDEIEDSDVFVYERARDAKPAVKRAVTLFVYGWENVEPGMLSWSFPSLRAALDAVQRMRNAIGWCVVEGTGWVDLDSARAHGAILVEQI